MKRLLLLAALALTGCTTLEERVVKYGATCKAAYGFEVGSDAHKTCVLELEMNYQTAARQVIIIPSATPTQATPLPQAKTHAQMMCSMNPVHC